MVIDGNQHEEFRRLQIEENKRRMQELGLLNVINRFNSQLKKVPTKRKAKQAHVLGARRSVRTAARPPVDYRRAFVKSSCRYRGASAVDVDAAVKGAIEKKLSATPNPAFTSRVLRSYGVGSSRVYIPKAFRDSHMSESERDERFTLEDEDQLEWSMSFDSKHGDLIQRWRAFNTHHAFVAGDCCLFELVEPLRFKVQIFRYDKYESKMNLKSGKKPKEEKSLSRKRKN